MPEIVRTAARIATALPPAWEGPLQRGYSLLKAAAEWRFPITRLDGSARFSGDPATLLIAGGGLAGEYLAQRFFAAEPRRESVGSAPIWAIEDRLDALGSGAALTVIQVDRWLAPFFFRRNRLAVPAWINMVLRIPSDPDRLARSSHSVTEDLRGLRHQEFQTRISPGGADLPHFYRDFYVPTTLRRHHNPTFLRAESLLRHRARRGGILWIHDHGRQLGGMLFERRKERFHLQVLGILDGDPAVMQRHVMAGLYWRSIQHAAELGCTVVEFGGVRPSLTDGLLRYKRKWGTALVTQSRTHYDLLVGWKEWNATVAGFLAETPLIFRRGEGLHGIGVLPGNGTATEAEAIRQTHLLWTDGLSDLTLVSTSGWETGASAPKGTRLVAGGCGVGEL